MDPICRVLPAETGYQLWHNTDPFTMYQEGDVMRLAWAGQADLTRVPVTAPIKVQLDWAAEWVFRRHNRDKRPDGRYQRSMSVGDVVVFPMLEVALACGRAGWQTVSAAGMVVEGT